jgi:hypothetical protein
MSLSVFTVYTLPQFESYIRLTAFRRPITVIQNHHTFKPDYHDFHAQQNHLQLLENMRSFHMKSRGWSDIGQNITTFPDGKIAVCRPIDIMPAGIFGANKGAICIENLGNFDIGKNGAVTDQMTAEQQNAILHLNALLCFKFSLQPVDPHIVYHHWFDTKGKRFTPALVNSGEVTRRSLQKTCPGTGFFGGNTINNAKQFFYPQVEQILTTLRQSNTTSVSFKNKRVTASVLNVRGGGGIHFPIIRKLNSNSIVQVFSEVADWSKINATADEWVSTKFLNDV